MSAEARTSGSISEGALTSVCIAEVTFALGPLGTEGALVLGPLAEEVLASILIIFSIS